MSNNNNVYPYSIKSVVIRVIPYASLSANNLDSVHAISLFKCMFKAAFQYTAIQDYDDTFIQKRHGKLNACFEKFVKYVTMQIAKANPQWTRRQLLDEVNEVVVSVMEDFADSVRRAALQYDGDDIEDPNAVYGPMYQTAQTLNQLVTHHNFLKHSKKWLQQRETRRVRAGIRSLRKSARYPLSQVFNDPYLSSHISNMSLSKPLTLTKERELDESLNSIMKKYETPDASR